jgi:hypothetical protein
MPGISVINSELIPFNNDIYYSYLFSVIDIIKLSNRSGVVKSKFN